jgi:dethiobiotin synthetase
MGVGCFVTGTDTEIGKTVIAAGLVRALVDRGLRVAVMKPVASGSAPSPGGLRNEDALTLLGECSVEQTYEEANPYAFEPPIAPHVAAAEAGVAIDLDRIIAIRDGLAARADIVVVEGVGGWQVPLGPTTTVASLARALGFPVLLVAGIRLGCINHTLLSAESIRASEVPLLGWIATEPCADTPRFDDNVQALTERLREPLLATVRHIDPPAPATVAARLGVVAARLSDGSGVHSAP